MRNTLASLLLASTLISGCHTSEEEESSGQVPIETASQPSRETENQPGRSERFEITYPQNRQIAPEYITLRGVGATKAVGMRVSVYTNQWWPQNGSFRAGSNGSWSYSGVTLGGKGVYNNHRIRATLIMDNGKTETAVVSGIRTK